MKRIVAVCILAFTGAVEGAAPRQTGVSFTIGGAVYTDLANPLTSGQAGVLMTVEGTGGTFSATTQGSQGIWFIQDVPEGTYTVSPTLADWCFLQVVSGTPGDPPPIAITVDTDHQAENQSLQFLASQDCPSAECGNGVVEGIEECDDGVANSDTEPDACRTTCVLAGCGDGVVDTGEECDDGNTDPGDGCDATCQNEPPCAFTIGGAVYDDLGNPITSGVEGVEVCVDCTGGFADCATTAGTQGLWQIADVPCDSCTLTLVKDPCTFEQVVGGTPGDPPPITIDVNEANQGANQSLQFLASDCVPEECGNGVVEGIEECDDGVANSDTEPDACRTTCVLAGCGDGVVDTGEECDDGNTDPGDGCDATCQNEPPCAFTIGGAVYDDLGNPITSGVEGVEVCVDCTGGFADCATTAGTQGLWQIADVPCDSCTLTLVKDPCTFEQVVGGTPGDPPPITIDVNEANQGANQSLQFLASDCVPEECGNGVVEGIEECDDGVANSDTEPDACRTTCVLAGCGDGVVDTGEECDDGNTDPGDGCDATCQNEPPCAFTIGGAVYDDLGNPITSGVEGVEVCVDCTGGFADCATTAGTQGLWQIADVPCDSCTLTLVKDPCTFEQVVGGTPGDPPPITIDVNEANQGANQSLQFLASDCVPEECGNGVVEGIEECDDGVANSDTEPDACRTSCELPRCGDGVVDTGEECDDGNTDPGDGCDAVCALECAERFTIGGAVYDDLTEPITTGVEGVEVCVSCTNGFVDCATTGAGQGLWMIADLCASTCTVTPELEDSCFRHVEGGGLGDVPPITIEVNEANQGANQSIQFLATDCTTCGDGIVEGIEECDDGPANSDTEPDACRTSCELPRCGDGVVDTGEECDDGNTVPDDGCDECEIVCVTDDDCDDDNVCTDDTCSNGACTNSFNTDPCDDGNRCTTSDSCSDGTCSGTPTSCSQLDDDCNRGRCNPATGGCEQSPTNNGGACDDGSLCTDSDVCSNGDCEGAPIDLCCERDDECAEGTACDPTVNRCRIPCAADNDCGDADPCTMNTCENARWCADPVVEPDGTPCEDGFFCTLNDTCIDGVCESGTLNPDCQGSSGRSGTDGIGIPCWDLNGDGVDDPDEDVNGDGAWDALDCQGADGADGADGTDGTPGTACWDLNGNGVGDPEEDVNGDEQFDARDCQPPDSDGDGVLDVVDNCPNDPNPSQDDSDGDSAGDACDDSPGQVTPEPDSDGDGVDDTLDQCPDTPAGTDVDALGCPSCGNGVCGAGNGLAMIVILGGLKLMSLRRRRRM